MEINSISKELFEFIRLKLCIFASFLAMSGYLFFNPLNLNLIFVMIASFFVVMGGYTYNNITDKEEDLINRKKVNKFATNNKSYLIVVFSFLIASFFSLFLSFYSIFFTMLGIISCTIYSLFRIKKYFLLKNIYTGFSVAQVFLLGANNITIEIFLHYLLISFFIFISSIISDLRDYKGDKISSIKTLPVFLGYDKTRKIVFILLVFFSFLIIHSQFIILLPFSFVVLFFVYKNLPKNAHFLSGISLVFLAFSLLVRGI
jgi:4-hydroxybenzoate polyprenyltransferase